MALFNSAATGASILAGVEKLMALMPRAPMFNAILAHPRTAATMARDATTNLGWQPSPTTVRASSVLGAEVVTNERLGLCSMGT